MKNEEMARAADIFTRPTPEWTEEEYKFLAGLFAKGNRPQLQDMLEKTTGDLSGDGLQPSSE